MESVIRNPLVRLVERVEYSDFFLRQIAGIPPPRVFWAKSAESEERIEDSVLRKAKECVRV